MDASGRMLQTLGDLVRIPSVPDACNAEIADYVAAVRAPSDARISVVPSSLSGATGVVASIGPDVPGGLILSGHLDVVTEPTVNTFTARAGCESRRPHGSLRPAPCEPPAPGQNRRAGLRAALLRAVAPARHAAVVFLVVVAGLLAVSTAAQAQTEAAVTVTIEAEYDPIGGGLEDLVFTLTRQGTTADELAATVTIAQDEAWLDASDLTHTVTFAAGEATASLNFAASEVSLAPETSGDLTATVSGTGISGGEDTVEIVSTAQPPITIRYDKSSYTFKEDADDEAIYAVATLHTAYPRPPGGFMVSFSARAGTAVSGNEEDEDELGNVFPFDYNPISWEDPFRSSDFVRDADTDPFMARKLVVIVALFRRIVIGNTECFQRVFVVQFMILPS